MREMIVFLVIFLTLMVVYIILERGEDGKKRDAPRD